jgi:hypothetical protein
MRKFVIFVVFVAALAFWFKSFIQSGQLDRYLDANPNPSVNPAVEYYWGMILDFANHKQSAVYRFSRVAAKYPKSEYAPLAWAESIETLDDMNDRKRVIEESEKFINSQYASHPKAEKIRRKLMFIQHGY